jgi:hypothetical protein
MRPSRRTFMKWVTTTGIAVGVSRFALAEMPDFRARETLPGPGSAPPLPGRIDGIAKVTGAKLYASDFRAADLPGWPRRTAHALLVRAPDATHVYQGLDLALLSGDAKPSAVVTADDLARARIRSPAFYAGDLLCPVGKTPLYLGQPVAVRGIRGLRPGAPGDPRWCPSSLWRRDRSGADGQLRGLAFHAHCCSDPGFPRRLFPAR